MFPKKAKATGPSGWCFAEQCRGWQRRGMFKWRDQGIIFQKTKKHSIPPFDHVVFTMFFYMFYWGKWWKMTLGHESRCSKITISWPVLRAWVWKFLPFLARSSWFWCYFASLRAAFSRVNLRFFRFLQPATSPKSTAILIPSGKLT